MYSQPNERTCKVCGKQFRSRYSVNFCGYACYRKHKMPSMPAGMTHRKRIDIASNGIDSGDRCKIILHPRESLKHFLVKSLVCRILFERRRPFVCEAAVENGNKVDVCDLSLQIAYEIEPSKDDKKLDEKFGKYGASPAIRDIIIVPYMELPDDVNLAYERLEGLVV